MIDKFNMKDKKTIRYQFKEDNKIHACFILFIDSYQMIGFGKPVIIFFMQKYMYE